MKTLEANKKIRNKNTIKTIKRIEQKQICDISDVSLVGRRNLRVDAKRIDPPRNGGKLNLSNVVAVDPVEHLKYEENFIERSPEILQLKAYIDGREKLMKNLSAVNNRLGSDERKTDYLDDETIAMLTEQAMLMKKHIRMKEKTILNHLESINHPMIPIMQNIHGVGRMSIAYLLTYVIIEKAESASSLWKFVGLHVAAHKRYIPGVKGGGHKKLRTALFNMMRSMQKTSGAAVIAGKGENPYIELYKNEKLKLSVSNKLTETYIKGPKDKDGNESGKYVMRPWKDTTPGHRDGAALRKAIKHFLADFWKVYRTTMGLSVKRLWIHEKAGHTGIVQPEQRGWVY